MALLWIEGFEDIGTSLGSNPAPTGVLSRKYPTVIYPDYTVLRAGRVAGYSLECTAGWPDIRTPQLTTNATMVVGLGYWFDADYSGRLFGLYDGTTLGMNVHKEYGGELGVYRGSTQLAVTSGLGLVTSTWYWIEFKTLCNSSAGTYELRVGGVSKLSASSQNTKAGSNNYHNVFQMLGAANGKCRYDDIFILDGSGSSNSSFLGNRKVVALYPNGDVAGYADFTCSSGSTHYALVDENPVNDDTDYVEDGTIGHKDLWDYPSLAGTGSNVSGIQINSMVRETDAASMTLNTLIKSGATEDVGTGEVIGSTSYRSLRRISETDPDTGLPWTVSGVNAAQFGIKVG
jgi:hypothetical protein